MRVRVKICGLRRLEEVRAAVEAGADAVGFNFVSDSPRSLTLAQAARLAEQTPPFVTRVGVWVDPTREELEAALALVPLDALQLHGSETAEFCASLAPRTVIKALRISSLAEIDAIARYQEAVQGILLDTYVAGQAGGTGCVFPWEWARQARERFPQVPLILAGGLTPDNVAQAIQEVRPYGVDVSSGVERTRGVKDADLIRQILREVERARDG